MKNFITIIAIFTTIQVYSQGWTELPNFTSGELLSVEVIDSNNIYTGGEIQGIYKTIDGGITWDLTNIPNLVIDIDFPSLNTGYFVGLDSVYKTSDAGNTWISIFNTYYAGDFKKIQFLDTVKGYILLNYGEVLKTIDGGNNWTQYQTPSDTTLCSDMYFFDENIGVVLDTTVLYKTIDGGTTWTTHQITTNAMLEAFYFVDSVGYVVGYNYNTTNIVLKTTDYGVTWDSLTFIPWSGSLKDVFFLDQLVGFIITDYKVYMTFDGGQSWEEETYMGNTFHEMDFCNCTGFIVGGNGRVYKTENCGISSIVHAGNDVTITCNESTTLIPTITYSGSLPLTYTWQPSYGLTDTTILNPIATPTITTTYTIFVTDGHVSAIDSVTVFVESLPTQEICMVTVDSVYGKNKIVWEKAALPIEDYYIWKETIIAGTYNLMDVVPYNSAGTYVDMTSDPNAQSDKYKISVLDSCGYISDMSDYHKTLHLNVSPAIPQGFALTWEHYEGFSFDTYVIYRKNNNNPFDSIHSIAYSPGVFTYTDINPPGGNIYYYIAAIKLIPCDTSMIGSKLYGEPYSQSLSNIEDNVFNTVNETYKTQSKIFPNPTTGTIRVQLENIEKVEILNLQGKEIYKGKETEIDLSKESKGIYIIRVTTEKGVIVEKVVLK